MIWEDECYLLSKRKFRENANIINIFTKEKGKVDGIVYGGTSRKIRNYLQISNKLQSLQGLDPIVRNIQWTILGNAHETEIDVNGRMLIRVPSDLQEYAEIIGQKQIAVVGMGNKFEIWNINSWEMRQTGGSLSTEILDVVLPESIKTMSF